MWLTAARPGRRRLMFVHACCCVRNGALSFATRVAVRRRIRAPLRRCPVVGCINARYLDTLVVDALLLRPIGAPSRRCLLCVCASVPRARCPVASVSWRIGALMLVVSSCLSCGHPPRPPMQPPAPIIDHDHLHDYSHNHTHHTTTETISNATICAPSPQPFA